MLAEPSGDVVNPVLNGKIVYGAITGFVVYNVCIRWSASAALHGVMTYMEFSTLPVQYPVHTKAGHLFTIVINVMGVASSSLVHMLGIPSQWLLGDTWLDDFRGFRGAWGLGMGVGLLSWGAQRDSIAGSPP